MIAGLLVGILSVACRVGAVAACAIVLVLLRAGRVGGKNFSGYERRRDYGQYDCGHHRHLIFALSFDPGIREGLRTGGFYRTFRTLSTSGFSLVVPQNLIRAEGDAGSRYG